MWQAVTIPNAYESPSHRAKAGHLHFFSRHAKMLPQAIFGVTRGAESCALVTPWYLDYGEPACQSSLHVLVAEFCTSDMCLTSSFDVTSVTSNEMHVHRCIFAPKIWSYRHHTVVRSRPKICAMNSDHSPIHLRRSTRIHRTSLADPADPLSRFYTIPPVASMETSGKRASFSPSCNNIKLYMML